VPAQKMIDRGLVAKFDPKQLTLTPEKFRFISKNNLPVVGHNTNLFIYNTNQIKRSDLPKGYLDLLNPEWKGKIELHAEAVPLNDYRGNKSTETAEIVIRKNLLRGLVNDGGFKLKQDGTYEAIVDGLDSNWLQKLDMHYQAAAIKEVADEYGYDFDMQVSDGGHKIHIECETLGF